MRINGRILAAGLALVLAAVKAEASSILAFPSSEDQRPPSVTEEAGLGANSSVSITPPAQSADMAENPPYFGRAVPPSILVLDAPDVADEKVSAIGDKSRAVEDSSLGSDLPLLIRGGIVESARPRFSEPQSMTAQDSGEASMQPATSDEPAASEEVPPQPGTEITHQ